MKKILLVELEVVSVDDLAGLLIAFMADAGADPARRTKGAGAGVGGGAIDPLEGGDEIITEREEDDCDGGRRNVVSNPDVYDLGSSEEVLALRRAIDKDPLAINSLRV